MQIVMHSVDDIDTADHIFSPRENGRFRDYLRDRYERTMDYLEKTSTEAGKAFMDRSRKIFDKVNSSEALRSIRNAVRSATSLYDTKNLFNIRDSDDIRFGNHEVQRYAMADPEIRSVYLEQRCDGYSDTYKNRDGNDIGDDHYTYRRATNGVFMPKQIDGEEMLERTWHYEQLIEGDRELDAEEQFAIMDLWDLQRRAFRAGLDTTNRLGGTLS